MAQEPKQEPKQMFKLNFNFILKDGEGFAIEAVKPGIKAGSVISVDSYEELSANRLLGRTLSMSNDDLGGVAFDWYPYLLQGKILEVSKAEAGTLKNFIREQSKTKNQNFSNVVVEQLLKVLEKAGYKE